MWDSLLNEMLVDADVWIVSWQWEGIGSPMTDTMCVKGLHIYLYIKKITVVLGLKSWVVIVAIRALGLDPKDH
jgi:hypothetical protein